MIDWGALVEVVFTWVLMFVYISGLWILIRFIKGR